MLQPNSFMSNALQWVPQLASGDVVRGLFGSVPVAAVDPADVGAVAALALTEPGHAGQTYRLSGPESLLPEEQVGILGRVLDRDLRWEGWTDKQAPELESQMPSQSSTRSRVLRQRPDRRDHHSAHRARGARPPGAQLRDLGASPRRRVRKP